MALTVFQILIDGRNLDEVDDDERQLPTLVYLAREKRPHCHHNFKAGSMNALVISVQDFYPFRLDRSLIVSCLLLYIEMCR